MRPTGFQVQMYKCILDSEWVPLESLTVLVGKNEAGKTCFLKALHKFNPFTLEPYNITRDWPRAYRDRRTQDQVVCTVEFELSGEERNGFASLLNQNTNVPERLKLTKDYAGRFEVLFPADICPDRLHPNDVDRILTSLPTLTEPVGDDFRQQVDLCVSAARRLAHEGRFSDLAALQDVHNKALTGAYTSGNPQPQNNNESQFVAAYVAKLKEVAKALQQEPSIHRKAHEYVVTRLPTFVYMDEYRSFQGTAMLDDVQKRKQKPDQSRGGLTEEDNTLLTILALANLDLDDQVTKGQATDREERQYDLADGAATLTRKIEEHWKQLKYEVRFEADGQQFFTFVKDRKDRALIRLEERSRGFQWFFSFDLLLMHQTKGTLMGCVILLDEPGLHLHPEGQQDLLRRLAEYAEGNTLIYTTHLPFMIDLQHPERIRVISETSNGATVTDDLNQTQPEGKLTLQAALGISGRTSFLVADQNLVVEGVDDYWILTAISNLLKRSGEVGLPEDLLITPAGGASEVTYIATFMIGQQLDVVALYDSDQAGTAARDNLVKKWLTRYGSAKAAALSLGAAVGVPNREFAIEDLFPDDFYLRFVHQTYERQLTAVPVPLSLRPGVLLSKRVADFFESQALKFNKGSVAKRICSEIGKMKAAADLPPETLSYAKALFAAITTAMPAVKP